MPDIESQEEHKFVPTSDHKRNLSEKSEVAAIWKSCCFLIDRVVLFFFTQLIISVGVMSFCVYQLIQDEDHESRQYYSSTLTFLIGIWIPSPRPRVN